MEFLFGVFVCAVVAYFFFHPAKAKELEDNIKSKIEEHKNERIKKD